MLSLTVLQVILLSEVSPLRLESVCGGHGVASDARILEDTGTDSGRTVEDKRTEVRKSLSFSLTSGFVLRSRDNIYEEKVRTDICEIMTSKNIFQVS